MSNVEEALLKELETVVCSRCGGTGHYSYNSMTGTVCFKCGGRKKVLTKRGSAANEFLRKLRSKQAKDIVAGEEIYTMVSVNLGTGGGTYGFMKVIDSRMAAADEAVKRMDQATGEFVPYAEWRIETDGATECVEPTALFRVRQTPEQAAATFAEAMKFQATLTKKGEPRKSSAKS